MPNDRGAINVNCSWCCDLLLQQYSDVSLECQLHYAVVFASSTSLYSMYTCNLVATTTYFEFIDESSRRVSLSWKPDIEVTRKLLCILPKHIYKLLLQRLMTVSS